MPKNPTPLRFAIVQSGRTQRDIAEEVGLHESRLSLIVNGLHADDATQAKIAKALRRDIAELFVTDVTQADAA